MASTACQRVSLNATIARTPTNTVANSRFGDAQVQNRVSGRPCRSASGMYSAPPGSTATTRSPYWPSRTWAETDGVAPADVATELSSGGPGVGLGRTLTPDDAPGRCACFPAARIGAWGTGSPPGMRWPGEDGEVSEPLEPALARLRPLIA